jgi:hypothetical protein
VSLLALVVLFGLVAAGITATVRAVIDSANPLWLLEKPFSCDLCMSWWSSIAIVIAWAAHDGLELVPGTLAVFGSIAVALCVTKAATRLSS